MLSMLGSLFMVGIKALTIVVPKAHKNHRLTFRSGPRIINSSVNENTRVDDYFKINEDFTHLTNVNGNDTLCQREDKELYACNKSPESIMFKIQDVTREVQFKDANGDCLTVGKYKRMDDSYEVVLEQCDADNINQIFILNKDHGPVSFSTIDRTNVTSVTENEVEEFRNKDRMFSDAYHSVVN